jgi:hypothetical protein
MEIFAFIIALLLGFGFVAICGSAFVASWQSRNWTRVRGRITAAWVSEHTRTDGRSSFMPAVRYEYQFEGREVSGDRIAFVVMGARHRGVATKTLERYPVGAEVDVYVDPRRPTRSVLRRGVSWVSLFATACGLGLIAFAIAMLSRE